MAVKSHKLKQCQISGTPDFRRSTDFLISKNILDHPCNSFRQIEKIYSWKGEAGGGEGNHWFSWKVLQLRLVKILKYQ